MYRMFLTLAIGALLCFAPAFGHDIHIDSHEIPLEIDTYGRFKQNQSMFMWTPFDSTREVWDMTVFPGGLWTRTGLRDYEEGRPPAPDSMEVDPPAPDVCEMDTLGSGSEQWVYLYKTDFGLYLDGIDFTQETFRFIGNYRLDALVYATPMYWSGGWMSAVTWRYEIIPGIPYVATEQHIKKIVAKGKVKVPMSGDYFWPCLVIKDYMSFSDNMGSSDLRWIYEWVVPGHFLGGNGVAAAMSQNGASSNFIVVEQLFQMHQADVPDWDLLPPTFANTRQWPDTNYAGPYAVWSTITDDDAVGAESLFYRVDQGEWNSAGPDSSSDDIYHFTIPQVTMPAQVDYYIWAKDEFSVDEDIDCWTTWPVCSPESTMISFIATSVGMSNRTNLVPEQTRLSTYPNPFHNTTRFSLRHTGSGHAVVRLFSCTGELVRTLTLDAQPASPLAAPSTPGILDADWDGCDAKGEKLPAGTYLFQVKAPGYTQAGKVLLSD